MKIKQKKFILIFLGTVLASFVLVVVILGLFFKKSLHFVFTSQNKKKYSSIYQEETEKNKTDPNKAETLPKDSAEPPTSNNESKADPQEPPRPSTSNLPSKLKNQAPFVPQAPFANWDSLHEEACEEASLITAHYFLKNESVSTEKAEAEIQALVAWQTKNFNGHHDLSANKIVALANSFYGDNLTIKKDPSTEELKGWLNEKRIIIVPAAGRMLLNPYFKQPGPIYHVLVVIGYDDKKQEFITNDPGTKRGKDFRYPFSNLMDSIHDFPGDKKKILLGEKSVIITEPNLQE